MVQMVAVEPQAEEEEEAYMEPGRVADGGAAAAAAQHDAVDKQILVSKVGAGWGRG